MRSLLIFAVAFASVQAHAQLKQVIELDSGACWASEEGAGAWKIASFNDGAAFPIDRFRLEREFFPVLERQLRDQGFDTFGAAGFQAHLYCSSAGHGLIFNFGGAERPFCAHASGALDETSVYPHFDGGEGECSGVEPLSLLVTPKPTEDVAHFALALRGPEHEGLVVDARALPLAGLVAVTLRAEYRFREDEARDQLLRDAVLGPRIESVDYNSVHLVSGSSRFLFDGEYGGY